MPADHMPLLSARITTRARSMPVTTHRQSITASIITSFPNCHLPLVSTSGEGRIPRAPPRFYLLPEFRQCLVCINLRRGHPFRPDCLHSLGNRLRSPEKRQGRLRIPAMLRHREFLHLGLRSVIVHPLNPRDCLDGDTPATSSRLLQRPLFRSRVVMLDQPPHPVKLHLYPGGFRQDIPIIIRHGHCRCVHNPHLRHAHQSRPLLHRRAEFRPFQHLVRMPLRPKRHCSCFNVNDRLNVLIFLHIALRHKTSVCGTRLSLCAQCARESCPMLLKNNCVILPTAPGNPPDALTLAIPMPAPLTE